MLSVILDQEKGVAIIEPDEALSEDDFRSAARVIDPYIEKNGKLNGILIHTKSFPGWDSFGALISHFDFVKDHHKKLSRVALCTDSVIGVFGETIASHFIRADVRLFSYENFEEAKDWAAG